MSNVLIDPTHEQQPAGHEPSPRLDSLAGKTIGLLDISKARGDVFLDSVEEQLAARGAKILRFRKPTFTKVAPIDLRKEIRERCDAVIEALAD